MIKAQLDRIDRAYQDQVAKKAALREDLDKMRRLFDQERQSHMETHKRIQQEQAWNSEKTDEIFKNHADLRRLREELEYFRNGRNQASRNVLILSITCLCLVASLLAIFAATYL